MLDVFPATSVRIDIRRRALAMGHWPRVIRRARLNALAALATLRFERVFSFK
jgi:hypothetical protein